MTNGQQSPERSFLVLPSSFFFPFLCAWILAVHFTYYVTFIQFSLLHFITENLRVGQDALRVPLLFLTAAGIASSLAAGFILDRRPVAPGRRFLLIAVLAAVLAAFSMAAFELAARGRFIALFSILGLLLGTQIVLLLGAFSTHVPPRTIGLFAGAAAGVSSLFTNLISGAAMQNPATIRTLDVILLATAPLVIYLSRSRLRDAPIHEIGNERARPSDVLKLLVPLGLLVAVDSFTFYPLASPDLLAHPVFSSSGDWYQNGVMHLIFALIAGLAYSRLGFHRTVQVAAAAMVFAAVSILCNFRFDCAFAVRFFYSALVGFYTVAFFAVFATVVPRRRPMTGIAAGVVLIGWLANPLGIGLEQTLEKWTCPTVIFTLALLFSAGVFALALKFTRHPTSPL